MSYADTLNNMGCVYYQMDRYSEARDHYRRSLEAKEEALGKEHISYASTLYNIGLALTRLGSY